MAERTFLGGVTNTTLHQESDGTLIVEEKQDCEGILEHNKRARNERFSANSPMGTVQEAFNIPMTFVLQWQRECGAQMFSDEHMAFMDRKMQSPEFSGFIAAPKTRDAHIIIKGAR